LVAGVGFTRLTGDDNEFMLDIDGDAIGVDIGSTKVGFTAGGLVTVKLNDTFGIQSGLLWSRKGGDGEARGPVDVPGLGVIDVTIDVKLTLDYVDIPVLGVFMLPVTESMSVRALAGPVIGFNTKAEIEAEFEGASASEDIGDETKSVDLGALLGVGVVIPAGAVNLHADARYFFGFSSVDDSPADLDLKNAGLFVLASVGIPLGG
jgi:hypothetical protein